MDTGKHPTGDTMLYVDGSRTSFRCEECGSNVFKKVSEAEASPRYRCNGCGAEYAGEKSRAAILRRPDSVEA
jgi:predicted RNA-binding Zn-ribbon protein involved in translation (DUF1610 family)